MFEEYSGVQARFKAEERKQSKTGSSISKNAYFKTVSL
jgi:hypothetical protein